MKYYKVLGKGGKPCHGGTGKWHLPEDGKPGMWMPKIRKIKLCVSGYHLCREEELLDWLNEEIYEAEGRGNSVMGENKTVFHEARLLRKCEGWNERTARLFACDCAARVLPIYEKKYPKDDRPRNAIEAARKYAKGEITRPEVDTAAVAARAAAAEAAWAAAMAAARAAAMAAARDAAMAAARDAAWDAAMAAARDAARDAAWDAERKWQTQRLLEILNE